METPSLPAQGPNRAVYVDANGRWWDETYVLCKAPPYAKVRASQKLDADVTRSSDRQLLAILDTNPQPTPQEFDSYQEYELALLHWKEAIDAALLSAEVILPTPLGRYHYRPPFQPPSTYCS